MSVVVCERHVLSDFRVGGAPWFKVLLDPCDDSAHTFSPCVLFCACALQGSTWVMRFARTPIEWDAPLPIDESLGAGVGGSGEDTSSVLRAQVAWDLHHGADLAPSTYTFGKQVRSALLPLLLMMDMHQ